MPAIIQAVAVPILLVVSIGYLLFVAWASHRRRDEAEAERLAPPGEAQPESPESPQPPPAS